MNTAWSGFHACSCSVIPPILASPLQLWTVYDLTVNLYVFAKWLTRNILHLDHLINYCIVSATQGRVLYTPKFLLRVIGFYNGFWQIQVDISIYTIYDEAWRELRGFWSGISAFTVIIISGFLSPLHALYYHTVSSPYYGMNQLPVYPSLQVGVRCHTADTEWCVELRCRHGKRMSAWTENRIASMCSC